MKKDRKQKSKKLVLDRKTLRKLSPESLKEVAGATGHNTCYCYVKHRWTSDCY